MRLLGSLTNRIFLASAALAVVLITVAIFVVNVAVTRQAEAELRHDLEDSAALVDEYRALLSEHFSLQARLIADLPRLKAAVALEDGPTVQPIAAEYQAEVGAEVVVCAGRTGTILASAGAGGLSAPRDVLGPVIEAAMAGRETTAFWPHEAGILQLVTVPIWIDRAQPEILGALSMGFGLNERFASEIKALTDSEIAFASAGRVHASTLPGLTGPLPGGIAGAAGVVEIDVGGDEYLVLPRPLRATARSVRGVARRPPMFEAEAGTAPVALVLRSRSERLRFLSSLQSALVTTGLVAVLLATLVGYVVARTITRPLAAITQTMRQTAETGDVSQARYIDTEATWGDEDARVLARTFNAMTRSIARFQREAAQRERLSSLGRLATVIAHEVRNPLMIIKASLRALTRERVPLERVRQVAADIDDEVQRLNRIVNDVLDFARPIRFDYSVVDLNALCRDAARAAWTGQGEPAIGVLAGTAPLDVETDGERLRQALVNVLRNAQHAVEGEGEEPAAAAPPGDGPPVLLSADAVEGDRVAIVVRDRGAGIAPGDLPRLFEPFFTTRRAGSGLGLAIVKNIVEGLGGTIAVASTPGVGTEVRMELPRARPEQEKASA